jgi:hypothetical protein
LAGPLAERVAAVAPGGRLVLEFFHLLALIEEAQFDNVRHGHPLLLSLRSLATALHRLGWVVLDAHRVSVYGGSLIVTAAAAEGAPAPSPRVAEVLAAEQAAGLWDPDALGRLQEQAHRSAAGLREHLEKNRANGRLTLGYGAPSKASVLLGLAGVTTDLLPFTVDLAPAKVGRRIPGCAIPVASVQDLLDAQPAEVLVLTWDIAPEIQRSLPQVGRGAASSGSRCRCYVDSDAGVGAGSGSRARGRSRPDGCI